ncbi:MAG: peptidoglycan DD-metalloendopeptidase family protein [Bacillota bacterium]
MAAVLASLIVPVLTALFIFGFLYFSVFMLPRYITEGGPGGEGTMVVEATGYTAGYESTGKKPGDPGYGITATGTRAHHGTVAVDPSVIPLGMKMYIPGYGYGVAEDTGGAIKGNRIDLFFDDVDEALQWGRKTVAVRLFGKGKKSNNPAIFAWGESDTGWPFAKDEKLFLKYLKLDSDWFNKFQGRSELLREKVDSASGDAADEEATVGSVWGSYPEVVSEKDMLRPHRVHWALMASIDKVLGDPVVHGQHGMEDEQGTKGRKPDPDRRFKELEPRNVEWEEFELYYHHWWETKTKDGWESHSETYAKKIRVLKRVDTCEADFTYAWKPKVIEQKSEHSYLKVIVPQSTGVEKKGPLYARLKETLSSYRLKKDSNVELVLQLAMNLDDTFHADIPFSSPYDLAIPDVRFTGEPGEVGWPCPGDVRSPFGYRADPFTGAKRFHTGVDIANQEGTPVRAAASGIVVWTGWAGDYGKRVVVDHGSFRTAYAHLGQILVRPGREVKGGDVIGLMGSTGRSTGPHLHFEVIVNGRYIDPAEFIGAR